MNERFPVIGKNQEINRWVIPAGMEKVGKVPGVRSLPADEK